MVPSGWQVKTMGAVLEKLSDPVQIEPTKMYQEIGIRSHGKGIFHKEPVLGSVIGEKRVFWVKPDVFILNIVFAWEQAVARTTNREQGKIASHRFPMFCPKNSQCDIDYLIHFFKTKKGKALLELASPGGAGRNKTLGQKEFLSISNPLPPIKEQIKIAQILSTWDKAISTVESLIENSKTQTKALMQQMLTGKRRLSGFETSKWNIGLLGEVATIKARIGWRGLTSSEYTQEGPYLIASNHIKGSIIHWKSCQHISQERYDESPEIALNEGDVIISKDGTIGRIGYVSELPGQATINGTMMLIRPNTDLLHPKFLYHYLQGPSFQLVIKEKVSGSSVPHLFQRDMLRLSVPLITKDEQQQLLEIFDLFDSNISNLSKQLDSLKQEKLVLMQQLLTGKRRVKVDEPLTECIVV